MNNVLTSFYYAQGTTNKLSEVEIIRYQVLIPVTEVQVRSSGSGRDSQNSNEGSCTTPLPGGQSKNVDSPCGPEEKSVSQDQSQPAQPGTVSSGTSVPSAAVGSLESSSVPNAKSSNSQFIWDLIHLRCTQISGGTQRRTEKVYQLSNRFVHSTYNSFHLFP